MARSFLNLAGVVLLAGVAGAQRNAPAPAAPQQTAAQQAAATQKAYDDAARAAKVQQLTNQVERSYKSGVDNYRAGRLDAARLDFDFAVDLMLTSKMDLKSDGPMHDEFERIINAVNTLEMDALKQGNGFSPKVEAAPLDAASDVTFPPATPEVTAQLKQTLTLSTSDLPLIINEQVAGYINNFANSPAFHAHMLRSLERAGKYKTMIQAVLASEGVPQDLIYLAVAESGFQPQALNRSSGAGGMWQFMPTGAYGLARNGWFDERFDPEKSSRAYARYMKTLYHQFGDWYLAMAAYDWGPGNVQKAVMRTGYADYWELYRRNAMPQETKNYVPQILAAVIMAKNPEKYGLDKMVPDAAVVTDTVPVDYAIDLRLVADVTDSTLADIVALNPALLRLSTPRDINYDLHIPAGTKEIFTKRITPIPEEHRASWRYHEVRYGETMEMIAQLFHVSASNLAETNGRAVGSAVAPGESLVIPVASVTASAGSHPRRYTVRRGDTLVTIADRFGVSVGQLKQWNRLTSSYVGVGKSLNVAETVRLAPATHVRGRGAKKSGKRGAHASGGRSTRASGGRSSHAKATHSGGTKRASGGTKSSSHKKKK